MIPLLLTVATAAHPAVAEARVHLQAGRLDDVLFALEPQKGLAAADANEAASVLGDAARQARAKGDGVLALQFCQTALRHDARQQAALEVCAEQSLDDEHMTPAEGYADRLVAAAPGDAGAKILRARIAARQAEWEAVKKLLAPIAKDPRARGLIEEAERELAEKKEGLSTTAALAAQLARLMAAASEAKQLRPEPEAERPRRNARVTVYTTSWCGYCKRAKRLLTKLRVDFAERDIERDAGAAEELAERAAAAGVRAKGVPVLDVGGRLILGFDEREIRDAVRNL